MKFISGIVLAVMMAMTPLASVGATDSSENTARWDFDVFVNKKKIGKHFQVSGDQELQLPDCVMTFAYWNPDFLEVRGRSVPSKRFQLTADDVDLI